MRFLLLIFGLFMAFSCEEAHVEVVPDVGDIEVEFDIYRFEQALLQMDTFAPINSLETLNRRFPVLTELYLRQIIGIKSTEQGPNGLANDVKGLVTDPRMRYLMDTIQNIYPNMTEITKDFEQAYKYLKYYFPNKQEPDIYTIASEYTIGSFLFSDEDDHDALGVGLDFYLGSDYPYRSAVPNNNAFSRYLTRTFNRDHIVKKTLTPLIQEWLGRAEGSRLLDKMIHDGKERYILDKMLPFVSDTVIHEYSLEQLNFCQKQESDIWAFFLTENLLYTQQPHKINQYINPAPKSSGMPEAAPGRIGGYIGYRIVQSYMRRHPELSLDDLMANRDAQDILTKSKYRPR